LLDVIKGDQSQFLRFDEVDGAWKVVDPVLRVWATERDYIPTYPAGTWGPQETRRLFEREDQFWRHSLEPNAELKINCPVASCGELTFYGALTTHHF